MLQSVFYHEEQEGQEEGFIYKIIFILFKVFMVSTFYLRKNAYVNRETRPAGGYQESIDRDINKMLR
jgi:hypothetical protein